MEVKRGKRIYKVYSTKIIEFLWEHDVFPLREDVSYAVYENTPQLQMLLDSYFIRTVCFKNF